MPGNAFYLQCNGWIQSLTMIQLWYTCEWCTMIAVINLRQFMAFSCAKTFILELLTFMLRVYLILKQLLLFVNFQSKLMLCMLLLDCMFLHSASNCMQNNSATGQRMPRAISCLWGKYMFYWFTIMFYVLNFVWN